MDRLVSVVTVIVAITAVWVAVVQVRRASSQARDDNEIAVATSLHSEFRSLAFRGHLQALQQLTPGSPKDGFAGLGASSESAVTVCYLFEFLGQLVAMQKISEDLVLGLMSTQLVEVWAILEPYILGEREKRLTELPQGTPKRFLPHYEDLVVRVLESRGPDGVINIPGVVLRQLQSPISEATSKR